MKKKKVALLFGGRSSEYKVSLYSATAVLKSIDTGCYEVLPIGITNDGEWYYFSGSYDKICDDTWHRREADICPIAFSQSAVEKGFWRLKDGKASFESVDMALPVLHGKNGEDGTVQGLFELAGIPIIGCGTLSSALCMDKDRAHRLVEHAGIAVPKSVVFESDSRRDATSKIKEALRLPVFVKPICAGSSIGINCVMEAGQLDAAIDIALENDGRVIVEEAVEGFEVCCAVLGTDDLIVGRVSEIELTDGFFDYEQKYTHSKCRIHTPARISPELEKEVQTCAMKIYRVLGCRGFARIDMFITPEHKIVFNEANTIPGLTDFSLFPTMLKAVGISFSAMVQALIDQFAKD